MAEYNPYDIFKADDGKYQYADPTKGWQPLTPDMVGGELNDTTARQFRDGMRQVRAKQAQAPGQPVTVAVPPNAPGTKPYSPAEQAIATPTPASQAAVAKVQAPVQAPVQARDPNLIPDYPAKPYRKSLTESIVDAPSDLKKAVQETLESHGFSRTAKVLSYLQPGSWSEMAAMVPMFMPGYGALSLTSKLAKPIIWGGGAGLVTGVSKGEPVSGAASGAATGALAGLAGQAGETGLRMATGLGKTVWELTPKLFAKMNEKFGKPLGEAIVQSMPALQKAKITINNAMDMQKLFDYQTMRKIGQATYEKLEKAIGKKFGTDTIDMPVSETIGTRASTTKGTRTGSTARAGVTKGEAVSSSVAAETPPAHQAVLGPQAKVSPEGEAAEIATRASMREAKASGQTNVSARSSAEHSGASRSTSQKGVAQQPMTIDKAIEHVRQLRDLKDKAGTEETENLYHQAVDTLHDAIKQRSPKLAKAFENANKSYGQYMRFRKAIGGGYGEIFPKAEGGGLDILKFADRINSVMDQEGGQMVSRSEFGPLHEFFQGGGKPGTLPVEARVTPIGGYVHQSGLPSFHIGRRGTYPGIDTAATPAFQKALQEASGPRARALQEFLRKHAAGAGIASRVPAGLAGGSFGPGD